MELTIIVKWDITHKPLLKCYSWITVTIGIDSLCTHFKFLILTPHDLNSITFVLGSRVDPGGAPPGPLSSGFLLPPDT